MKLKWTKRCMYDNSQQDVEIKITYYDVRKGNGDYLQVMPSPAGGYSGYYYNSGDQVYIGAYGKDLNKEPADEFLTLTVAKAEDMMLITEYAYANHLKTVSLEDIDMIAKLR